MDLMDEAGFAQAHCHSCRVGKKIEKIAGKVLSGCADRTVSTGIAGEVRAALPFLSRSFDTRSPPVSIIENGSLVPQEILVRSK